MRDSAVVESIVAGDPGALAAAYDEYGDLVYAYCRTMLGGPREAAEAAQAAFVSAAVNAHRLSDPGALRAWLFALARSQCAYSHRHRQDPGTGTSTSTLSIAAGTKADRAVLRDAIDGLSTIERDVLTLLWHGLEVDEAALVLGRPRNDVYSRLSRASDQLETAVTVLLVCHHGRRDCRELHDLTGDWDGCLTEQLRDSAARHIAGCAACARCRDRELRPALVLSLTPGALLRVAQEARSITRPAPPWLRDRLLWLVTTDDPRAEAECRAMDRRLDPFGKTGFPRAGGTARTWRTGLTRPRFALGLAGGLAAVAAAVALIVIPGRTASPAQTGAAAGFGPGQVVGAVSPGAPVTASPSRTPRNPRSPRRTPRPTPSRASPSATPAIAQPAPAGPQQQAPPSGVTGGTLSVSPSSISVGLPFGSTVTLTAGGAPVTWSVSVPSADAGQLGVSPESGTLSAGQSVTVSVTARNANNFRTTLTFSPGDHTVTVQAGSG